MIFKYFSCSYAGENDFVCMSSALKKLRPDLIVRYIFEQTDYHVFMTSSNCNSKRPDIVAALNCGFVFYKQWDASLPDMVSPWAHIAQIFLNPYSSKLGGRWKDCNYSTLLWANLGQPQEQGWTRKKTIKHLGHKVGAMFWRFKNLVPY